MTKRPWILVLCFTASCATDDDEHDDAAVGDTDGSPERRSQADRPHELTADEIARLSVHDDIRGTRKMTLSQRFGDDARFYIAPGDELVLDAEVTLPSHEDPGGARAIDNLRAEDDTLAACASSYEEGCLFPTGMYELVWECDFPPLEPWTPYVEDPDTQVAGGISERHWGFPNWPPPQCYQIDAEIVHEVVCENSCMNCSTEICTDIQTGQQWSHVPFRRPEEFVDCTGRTYSTCGGGDDGDPPIDCLSAATGGCW